MSGDRHGGKIREAAAAMGRPPSDFLDVSANVNFLGPSPPVVAAARRAVDEMGWYPLDPPSSLRRAAAHFLQAPEERVLLGNGASELISLVVAYLRPRRVLIIGPTFTEYERAARAWGAEIDVLWMPEERDFVLSAAELEEPEVAARVRAANLIFYCDPNNPTGGLLERDARVALLDAATEAGALVFADESFLAFTDRWPQGSVLREERLGVIVLHSFTKVLAMPGLRVGALVVPTALARDLGPRVPPWNINCVAQQAALAAFSETEMIARTPGATAAARAGLVRDLIGLPGVEAVLPADANFLCLRLLGGTATEVADLMAREHGVLVRDLTDFPGMGPFYLRVAVRGTEENVRVVQAFREVLQKTLPASSIAAPAGAVLQ